MRTIIFPFPCTCRHKEHVGTGEHKSVCPRFDLVPWRVWGHWLRGYRELTDGAIIQARTPEHAIHVSREGFEPAHSLVCTGKSRGKIRQVDRYHFDLEGRSVTVEPA